MIPAEGCNGRLKISQLINGHENKEKLVWWRGRPWATLNLPLGWKKQKFYRRLSMCQAQAMCIITIP